MSINLSKKIKRSKLPVDSKGRYIRPPRTAADYPKVKMTKAEERYYDEYFRDWGYIHF